MRDVPGSGKIGSPIFGLLAVSGDYRVQLPCAKPDAVMAGVNAHEPDHLQAFELNATGE